MIGWLRYTARIFRHKAYVLQAGVLWTRAPLWRLLVHDLSKYRPVEARGFYPRYLIGPREDATWGAANVEHVHGNPHHWEYWALPVLDSDGTLTLKVHEIPDWALREMVADWYGAGRIYQGYWCDPMDNPWWQTEGRHILARLPAATRRNLLAIMNEAKARRSPPLRDPIPWLKAPFGRQT